MAITVGKLQTPEGKIRRAPMSKQELSPHVLVHDELQGQSTLANLTNPHLQSLRMQELGSGAQKR